MLVLNRKFLNKYNSLSVFEHLMSLSVVAALLPRNTQVYKYYYLLEALNANQSFVTLTCLPDVVKRP